MDYFEPQPEEKRRPRLSREVLSELVKHLQDSTPVAAVGFFPTVEGDFYAMHFWVYSLLAVPFYVISKLFNLDPILAFGFLNIAFVGFVYAYVKRFIPEYRHQAFLLFLVMGTIFYLRWTGPEVMSASCVFVASIAILRGEIALAILLSGLGATQNPSIAFMMPMAIGYGVLIYRWPQLACLGKTPPRPSRLDYLMVFAGLVLGLMSYAFYQTKFSTPSLIAQYAAHPSLISTDRFFSLFFDLNQGMVIGLPGVIFVLIPGLFLTNSLDRIRWMIAAFLLIGITVVMAVPTLSTGNWNPGGLVMLRYNYWLGMPLLVLLILGLILMPKANAKWIFLLALSFQGLVLVGQGIEKSSYVQHTPLARWVLKNFPSFYNPEAEIFFERSEGRELRYTIDSEYLYESDARPHKLLRHWSNFSGAKNQLCPAGSLLIGNDLREVGEGWQYLHPPFRCEAINNENPSRRIWRIRAAAQAEHSIMTSGWSGPEQEGTWSDQFQSVLTLPVPAGEKARRVRFKGQYYGSQRTSVVTVNGRKLGHYNLSNGEIPIPSDLPQKDFLQIILQHPNATSPKSQGRSEDARPLGFFLEAVSID